MIVVNTTQDTSTTSLTLSGLKKFTLYNVQVAAFSSENGPFLNVTVKTAEDSKYQWLIMRSGIMFVYTSKPHNLVRFQAFWFFLPPSYMHQNDKYAWLIQWTLCGWITGTITRKAKHFSPLRGFQVDFRPLRGLQVDFSLPSEDQNTASDLQEEKKIYIYISTCIHCEKRSFVWMNLASDKDSLPFPYFPLSFTAPTLPPMNLTAPNITSRVIRVAWKSVPEGFLHGILRGYKVQYYQTSLGNSIIKSLNVTANQGARRKRREVSPIEIPRTTELVDLLPYTNYTVHVTAITIAEGVWSQFYTYITDEEGKESWNIRRNRGGVYVAMGSFGRCMVWLYCSVMFCGVCAMWCDVVWCDVMWCDITWCKEFNKILYVTWRVWCDSSDVSTAYF